jgi:hypothetical protein
MLPNPTSALEAFQRVPGYNTNPTLWSPEYAAARRMATQSATQSVPLSVTQPRYQRVNGIEAARIRQSRIDERTRQQQELAEAERRHAAEIADLRRQVEEARIRTQQLRAQQATDPTNNADNLTGRLARLRQRTAEEFGSSSNQPSNSGGPVDEDPQGGGKRKYRRKHTHKRKSRRHSKRSNRKSMRR